MENQRPKPQGTCLIAGCGYTGTRLARRLKGLVPLLALVRSEASARALQDAGIPARAFDFDGASAAVPLDLPPDLASVVYMAPPPAGGGEDPRLGRFLGALGGARPGLLVYLSTTGVYGDTGGAPVDEGSPTAPLEARSRARLDAEGRAARWCAGRDMRCVLFRVPGIYGPGRLPLERLRLGEPLLRAEDSGPGNRIHVDDLVEACRLALERPVAGVFNLGDGCPESMTAFFLRVAALAGLPAPPQVGWAEAQAVMNPGMLAFLRESRLVLHHRMVEALGLCLRYPHPEGGIRASLLEMGL